MDEARAVATFIQLGAGVAVTCHIIITIFALGRRAAFMAASVR